MSSCLQNTRLGENFNPIISLIDMQFATSLKTRSSTILYMYSLIWTNYDADLTSTLFNTINDKDSLRHHIWPHFPFLYPELLKENTFSCHRLGRHFLSAGLLSLGVHPEGKKAGLNHRNCSSLENKTKKSDWRLQSSDRKGKKNA